MQTSTVQLNHTGSESTTSKPVFLTCIAMSLFTIGIVCIMVYYTILENGEKQKQQTGLTVEKAVCGGYNLTDWPNNWRIYNGKFAESGQFPWLVFVYAIGEEEVWSCGGLIASSRWIITSFHCVNNTENDDIRIFTGRIIRPTDNYDEGLRVDRRVVPDSGQKIYDIAMLHLAQDLQFDWKTREACLPDADFDETHINYYPCFIAGFGWNMAGPYRTRSNGLQYARITDLMQTCTVTNSQNISESTSELPWLCAHNPPNTRSACIGDSGGPVMCFYKQKWLAVGINLGIYPNFDEDREGIYCPGDFKCCIYNSGAQIFLSLTMLSPWIRATLINKTTGIDVIINNTETE